ncbi:MAG TPA: PAS domain-containing sensor histidine kinase, partial [Candidatus Hydrogenedentes bacterium]|nr:PAS domain-containing sensor histidine kinase [Candidatus Hydrogenedentota bacterium]
MIPIILLGFCVTLQTAALVFGVYLLRGSFWRKVWLVFDVILVLIGLRRSLLILSALSDVAAGDLAAHAVMQDLIALLVLAMTLFSGIFIIHFMFRSIEKAAAVLRESEEKYHNIFKGSRDSLTLLDASLGRFVTWNPAALNMFKIDAEALASSTPSDLSPPYQPDGRPSDEKAREMIDITLETGAHFFEWVHKRFTGEEFFATVLLTRIAANDKVLIQATVRDITEQKLAEAALRESEARYNHLAALSRTVTWEVDATGLCTYISDVVTDVLGYRPDELIGKKHCYDLGYAPPGVNIMERNLELLASKKPFLNMENQMMHKDGHPVRIVSNGMPILDASGNLLGYRGMDTDITEQKRLEEEKQQLQEQFVHAQKMESVGRLAGGIAHDFNNKLGVILGYLELAQKQTGDNASLREALDKISVAANSAVSLTRQILAFARKQTVAPRQINLNESTENMLVMLQKLIGEGVSTTWIPGSASARVKIDPAQIDQILTNLLLNARDAISENGSITIETSDEIIDEVYCAAHAEAAPGQYVALSISDD